jgi:hypothetical protein
MKKPNRTNYSDEGSVLEYCLFAVFFIVVFSVIARADVDGTDKQFRKTEKAQVSFIK